jgi:hypothetical protein
MATITQDGADGHNFERGPPKDHFSSLFEIGSVVSEKIFFKFHPPFKKIFSSETTEPISTKLC